ncbi:MAG TPA: PDZ domain-containing protein [Terriglobia bacterium]|nr:PDZ domain-containing protein [Terriglobia bacterium]
MAILLILILTLSLETALQAAQDSVVIDYLVDVSQPGAKAFQVQARIERLSDHRPVISFPAGRSDPLTGDPRISNLGIVSKDNGFVPLALKEDRVVVEDYRGDPLVFSYRVASGGYLQLDKTSYLDETRSLLYPQDILLRMGGKNVRSTLSFVLPPHWKVITTVGPTSEGVFRVEAGRPTAFYLGEAVPASETIRNTEVFLAVEPGWAAALSDAMESLREQLMYCESLVPNSKSEVLLGVFLSAGTSLQKRDVVAFAAPRLLLLAASGGPAETGWKSTWRQELSRGLVRCYYPILENFVEALNPSALRDYLALKTRLKTGGVTRHEFLQSMAKDLWKVLGTDSRHQISSQVASAEASGQEPATPATSRGQNYFLTDLALTFYGDHAGSLEEFLHTKFAGAEKSRLSGSDFHEKIAEESRARQVLDRLWIEAGRIPIGETLRPFGLLFERRELLDLPFRLTETFQVAQVKKSSSSTAHSLQVGDRILAVNHHRLTMPDDLLKFRSQLNAGEDVQLFIERNGVAVKLKQRIPMEVLLKLEVNKLADADKQQKLERFLSRYSDGA